MDCNEVRDAVYPWSYQCDACTYLENKYCPFEFSLKVLPDVLHQDKVWEKVAWDPPKGETQEKLQISIDEASNVYLGQKGFGKDSREYRFNVLGKIPREGERCG